MLKRPHTLDHPKTSELLGPCSHAVGSSDGSVGSGTRSSFFHFGLRGFGPNTVSKCRPLLTRFVRSAGGLAWRDHVIWQMKDERSDSGCNHKRGHQVTRKPPVPV